MTHDTYLKLWQLAGAALPGLDYLLFDEAQDANPVMVDIAVRQGVPVIWAGDRARVRPGPTHETNLFLFSDGNPL